MKIAILGSGLVAATLVKILEKAQVEDELTFFSDHVDSIDYRGQPQLVRRYEELKKNRFDVVFGCLDETKTRELYPEIKAGLFVDNSELFRLTPTVPLLVGDLNSHLLTGSTIVASNPNCVVLMAAHLLLPLSKVFPIKKVVMTTMQSASGLGRKGLENLKKERADNEYLDQEVMPRFTLNEDLTTLFNNVIPVVGSLESNGSTHEENKIAEELRKIIGPNFEIASSCYRIPVDYGHTASLHVTLEDPVDLNRLTRFIELNTPLVFRDVASLREGISDPTKVTITRIKGDQFCPYAFSATLFSNNLTVGAAYNSFLIYQNYRRLNNVL